MNLIGQFSVIAANVASRDVNNTVTPLTVIFLLLTIALVYYDWKTIT